MRVPARITNARSSIRWSNCSDCIARRPFALLDSDNGGELLNWHVLRWCQERSQPVAMSRSRPYHKDDNAHIEQKNWTHIRQWFGYER